MRIAIIQLLRSFNIYHVLEGKNTARGHVNVTCPWCGRDDPSEHMGVNLQNGYYSCWRNRLHSGRDFRFLLMRLTGLSWDRISEITVGAVSGSLEDVREWLAQKPQVDQPALKIVLDPGFFPVRLGGRTGRFAKYLTRRGFPDPNAVASYYRLYAAIWGQYNNRIIFPVEAGGGHLVGWTGRAISPARSKYLAYPPKPSIKEHLLFYRHLIEAEDQRILVITEGPFDALKIDWYGKARGIRATAVFGRSITSEQLVLLGVLSCMYERIFLCLDDDAWGIQMRIAREAGAFDFKLCFVQASDPGSLTQAGLSVLYSSLERILKSERKNYAYSTVKSD